MKRLVYVNSRIIVAILTAVLMAHTAYQLGTFYLALEQFGVGPVHLLQHQLRHQEPEALQAFADEVSNPREPVHIVSGAEARAIDPDFEAVSSEFSVVEDFSTTILLIGLESDEQVLVIGPMNHLRDSILLVFEAAIIILIAAGTAGFFVTWPLVNRIRRLERTARRVSGGDLSQRVQTHGPQDELGDLAHHFNQMTERIEEHVTQQQRVLDAVSHECRTPISRIRFALELLGTAADKEARARYTNEIDAAVGKLEHLVSEVLAFSRYGTPQAGLSPERFDVHEAVESSIGSLGIVIGETRILNEVPDGLTLSADRRLFERVVANLVINAVKHCEGTVRVDARTIDSTIAITVHDDGPGMPAAERDRVFLPFVVLDDARARGVEGVGLGLAIVSRILRVHGGHVEAGESDLGGAAMETTWPTGHPT